VMQFCELCGIEATHVDSAVTDLNHSRPGQMAYRQQPLCLPHAIARRESNTARVFCLHNRLDCDGVCFACGSDCRGIGS
jgi:hypothetical protein